MDDTLRRAGLFQGVEPEAVEALAGEFDIFEAQRGSVRAIGEREDGVSRGEQAPRGDIDRQHDQCTAHAPPRIPVVNRATRQGMNER